MKKDQISYTKSIDLQVICNNYNNNIMFTKCFPNIKPFNPHNNPI